MLRCTMKTKSGGQCTGNIMGMTGLQEIQKLVAHFYRVHKMGLTMDEALRVRIDMEEGREPNLMRAMLGDLAGGE
jgi:hypothetical protein